MNKPFRFTTIAVLAAASAASSFAKDKDKDKKKQKDSDKERVVYVERDSRRYYVDGNGERHWIDDDRGRDARQDFQDVRRDRSRTIYVIERDRPVERVVYIDPDGRYYRSIEGRRVYVSGRYYETYPSRYYHPDGRRRVTITLPF